jgi:hypothetical protein
MPLFPLLRQNFNIAIGLLSNWIPDNFRTNGAVQNSGKTAGQTASEQRHINSAPRHIS